MEAQSIAAAHRRDHGRCPLDVRRSEWMGRGLPRTAVAREAGGGAERRDSNMDAKSRPAAATATQKWRGYRVGTAADGSLSLTESHGVGATGTSTQLCLQTL